MLVKNAMLELLVGEDGCLFIEKAALLYLGVSLEIIDGDLTINIGADGLGDEDLYDTKSIIDRHYQEEHVLLIYVVKTASDMNMLLRPQLKLPLRAHLDH